MHKLKAEFSGDIRLAGLSGIDIITFATRFDIEMVNGNTAIGGADDIMRMIGMMAARGLPWLKSVAAL